MHLFMATSTHLKLHISRRTSRSARQSRWRSTCLSVRVQITSVAAFACYRFWTNWMSLMSLIKKGASNNFFPLCCRAWNVFFWGITARTVVVRLIQFGNRQRNTKGSCSEKSDTFGLGSPNYWPLFPKLVSCTDTKKLAACSTVFLPRSTKHSL